VPGGLAGWRAPQAVHDPGKIIADLVVTLALDGDCLADIAVLRAQQELAEPVASGPVVSRLISALAADAPRALKAIQRARAAARERAWALADDRAPAGLDRRCCSRCPAGGGSAGSGSSARWTRPGPTSLSVHELAGPEVLEESGYQAAISTPWRDRVVALALRRERWVFGLCNAIGV
jgi:hypothetical protein